MHEFKCIHCVHGTEDVFDKRSKCLECLVGWGYRYFEEKKKGEEDMKPNTTNDSRTCESCKHEDRQFHEEPCRRCIRDSIADPGTEETFMWEPKPEKPEETREDKVNHPSHYTFGKIEVINYIQDKLTPEEYQGYCQGNVLKYVSRYRHKGGVEDLKKARVYLDWLIQSLEEKEAV